MNIHQNENVCAYPLLQTKNFMTHQSLWEKSKLPNDIMDMDIKKGDVFETWIWFWILNGNLRPKSSSLLTPALEKNNEYKNKLLCN